MKLVTIVSEALARVPLTRLFSEVGAHGYTIVAVEGAGAKGARSGDISEGANIRLEVVVPPPVAADLLTRLEHDFFPHYAIVAWESDVHVLRREKF